MLTREQFHKIKHKTQFSMQDIALLIVTVEQLDKRNIDLNSQMKQAIKRVEELQIQMDSQRRNMLRIVKVDNDSGEVDKE